MNPVALNNFFESLRVMGLGMSGIFVVILVFYGMIVLLGKLMPGQES